MMNTILTVTFVTLSLRGGGAVHKLGTLACDTDETKARFSPCKEIQVTLGFCFHAMDSGLQLLGSRSLPVELGFRIPIVIKQERNGFRIATAVFRIQRPRIPDSTGKNFQNPGFHKPKISKIPDSTCKNCMNPHSLTWPWGDEIHTTPDEFTTGLKFMLTRNHLNITKVQTSRRSELSQCQQSENIERFHMSK